MNTRTRFGHLRPARRSLSLLLALWLIASLCACGGRGEQDLLAYQSRPFRATLRGELPATAAGESTGSRAFEAEIVHTVTAEDDTLTLTFTAPAALAGITLCRRDGVTTVSLGDISVDASGWRRGTWVALLDLFALQGTPQTITAEGKERTVVIFRTAQGETVTVTLDAKSGIPRRVACGGLWAELSAFETEE